MGLMDGMDVVGWMGWMDGIDGVGWMGCTFSLASELATTT